VVSNAESGKPKAGFERDWKVQNSIFKTTAIVVGFLSSVFTFHHSLFIIRDAELPLGEE
jgi:hypothetical protein